MGDNTAMDADPDFLKPDDPLFQMVGLIDSGVDDLGRNHDHYLYGSPRLPAVPAVKASTPARKPSSRRRARSRKTSA
jgi:hypothetical protein